MVRGYGVYMDDTPQFFKTTVTIFTRFDGTNVELSQLAREAEDGDGICVEFTSESVTQAELPQDARAFFDGSL